MALALVPPGARKGNKHFLIRGSYRGVVYEKATNTTDPRVARSILREFQDSLATAVEPKQRFVTFAEAAQRYVEFRNPSKADRLRIDKLVSEIGSRFIRETRPSDLHDVALRLHGSHSPGTRNREVLRPATTILHHAADAGLCDWIRIRAFKEPRPKTRALDLEAAAALIEAASPGPQRRLLVWLFYQGTRISDTLRVRWSDIDLDQRVVRMRVSKTDRFETFPLHEATLRELGPAQTGPVFPWSNRSSLRRWLPALAARAGVPFTAHMARHTLGTALAANGATLRAIMGALGHTTPTSSLRYQAADIEMVRAATAGVQLPQAKTLGTGA